MIQINANLSYISLATPITDDQICQAIVVPIHIGRDGVSVNHQILTPGLNHFSGTQVEQGKGRMTSNQTKDFLTWETLQPWLTLVWVVGK